MNNFSKAKELNNILKVGSKNLNSENWMVFHPNGKHMFTCGEKKAFWYLDRKLAKIIDDKKIKLTFIPNGNGYEDNEIFGLTVRETKCVVSGRKNGLQRHHIVPYCYRTYFPDQYKSKNHHDVVLINHEIHSEYEMFANQYKNEIANIYDVKTITEFNSEYTKKLREAGKETSILLNTIHLFFKYYGTISNDLKFKKLQFISEQTNIPIDTLCNYNYFQLYKIYQYLLQVHQNEINEFKNKYKIVYDHGYHVVQKLNNEEKIENFVKLWRNHFIKTMKPKFMPQGWSIDFRIKTKL